MALTRHLTLALVAGLAVGCQGTSCRGAPRKTQPTEAAPALLPDLKTVVTAYRTIIVLLADEGSLDAETPR